MVTSNAEPAPAHITSIKELEETAAARIAALDSTRFRNLPSDRWHESREPLTASESTVGNSHLAFSVSVESAPAADDDSGGSSGLLTVDAELVVVYLYKLPATDRKAAERLSTEAARSILGAMLAGWSEASVSPRQAYRPGPVNADGFLPVELRFVCRIDLVI